MTDDDAVLKKQYEIIGEFVAKVNSLEFVINSMLEQIIGQYTFEANKNITEEIIDHIEEQSIKIRINQIILFLYMTKKENVEIQTIIIDLKEFASYYNKNIRNIRDFIAHNTLMVGPDIKKVVSSRRYKGKLDSMEMQEIQKHTEQLGPKIDSLFKISEKNFRSFSNGNT